MTAEVSYLSRFLVKFVEIIAAGLASAVSAYVIAHYGGVLLSAPAPAATVQAAPTGGEVAAQAPLPPPVVPAAASEPHPSQQRATDARIAPPAGKAQKEDGKTPPGVAEKKKPQSEKSAEALARAALAKFDVGRPTPADATIRRPPRARAAAGLGIQADPQPRSLEVAPGPANPLDLESRRTAADPLPPSAAAPIEIAAPKPAAPADQERGVLSALKRIPDLLRPDPPPLADDAPRPPAPIGTASR